MIVCYVILRRQIYKIISNNQIKKNRFIFQNIFISQFYFLKIRYNGQNSGYFRDDSF